MASSPNTASVSTVSLSKQDHDIEAQQTLPTPDGDNSVHVDDDEKNVKTTDPNLVSWDGPDDPEFPKNWPRKAKWQFTVAVSLFTFISPVSSSMVAPALNALGRDLHTSSQLENYLALSIFILAYAIGPIIFGPASEMYGRKRILQISNLWYFAWNLGCGFATNKSQFFAFRFLAGLGGSAPLAVGGGSISDVWDQAERGKAMGIYTLAPILGPVLGPLTGGFIAEYSTWRWVFWSSSIAAILIQVAGALWLRESHAPTLLAKRKARMIKETGNHELHTAADSDRKLVSKVLTAVARPCRMFFTQPVVALIALYMAYIFGINYLLFATFPDVWSGVYGESLGVGGLNYISMGIGSFIGLFGNFFVIDRIFKHLKAKNNGVARPEYRIPTMVIGSALVTIGLFWYGWSVEARVTWIVPNLGIVVFSAGTMVCMAGMQTYTIDTYQLYAASAMAAVAILRSLCGFAFPLFAPSLYESLGYGWGTSVLAFISIGLGWTAPLLLWVYGEKLRRMSRFAAG